MHPAKRFQTAIAIAALGAFASSAALSATPAQLETNKKIVTEFYEAALNKKDYDVAAKYLGTVYKQHNPTAADGPEGLKGFIGFLKSKFPDQKNEIKRVIAEDDLVVLHVHSRRDATSPGRAIVDIFRVQNGKVVEHWDVIQDVPEKPANANGMF